MRNITLLFFLLAFSLLKAGELVIVNQNLTSAIKLAKDNNKLILVDFYTDWCAPCKVFEKNLHNDQELRDELDKNYIILRYDVENDKEFKLAKKFHISSYPTLAIITANIDYIDRLLGNTLNDEKHKANFSTFINNAVVSNETKDFAKGYSQDLDIIYPKFYTNYFDRIERYKKTDIEEFWESETDWESEVSFCILYYFTGTDSVYSYFLENMDSYADKFGEVCTQQVVRSMFYSKYRKAISAENSDELFASIKKETDKYLGIDYADKIHNEQLIHLHFEKENWIQLELMLHEELKNSEDLGKINYYSWKIYESNCNTSLLNSASTWMEKVIKKESSFAYLDTYACLLFKSGEFKLAKKFILLAIEKAKETKQNFSSSEKVLVEINAQLQKNN